MAGGQNPDYKVQMVDAVLFACNVVLSPTVQMAHIKALEKGTAMYPIRPVDCKVYSIPQGAMSHTHDNLFIRMLPKLLILWCIATTPTTVNTLKTHSSRRTTPLTSWPSTSTHVSFSPNMLQPNFETGSYIRSYVYLFSATGKQANDEGNELSCDDIGKGYTFLGFDLTLTVAVSIWQERIISEIHFATHWNTPRT